MERLLLFRNHLKMAQRLLHVILEKPESRFSWVFRTPAFAGGTV